jgi:hypothetical protein
MKWYTYIILVVVFLVMGWFTTTGVKSQWVRLGDVFLLGPFLIWAATQVEQWWVKVLLVTFGASTIAYNARNWLTENKPKSITISHPASWGIRRPTSRIH